MKTNSPDSYRLGLILFCAVLFAAAWPALAQEQAEDQSVDEATAKAYEQLKEQAQKGVERIAKGLNDRYQLTDDQQQKVKDLVKSHVDLFIKDNGRQLVEMMQRQKAMMEFVHDNGLSQNDIPDDIKQDLGRRALELMDTAQKHMESFGDDVEQELTDEQKEKFTEDRKGLRALMKFQKIQVRSMAGLPAEDGEKTPASGPAKRPASEPAGGGTSGGGAAPKPSAVAVNVDAWEAFVKRFIDRYKLDEVQKVQAMDLLTKYKDQAEKLRQQPDSQPASQPSTLPAGGGDMDAFRNRLAATARQRKPYADLFEQLKAELDKIPTPSQRQLADGPTKAVASQPAAPAAAVEK